MSNPIEGGPRPIGSAATQPGKGHKVDDNAPQSTSSRAGVGADEAETSERLKGVRDRIDQTPEVDRARVDAIKEKIANGDYPVDAEKIARKFAQFEALIEEEG
ncbi:flagellar biosynthesis anti-sigma factor FlgM [Halorhodospira halochloris]|uniref:Negative regulator of flagellin synthesis n=1 Tax=Halorhodospira halochloris TaxID=1052 RepID=A0A0X8XBU9_HALHR|nr:flagellar biosynthesis anti-sigma factor FlgM [Halorhodospira halochloris]MBK1651788.1 flagellar biosynthesis anti-sigma factor FlgM [Halorhodospira halochloris]MCG5530022.1 flagellar biosynthesis anti-sigma factor FlgM [Halorhodospira halochloris]MCG5548295.1 flagellar biosynthesis anti-sigma factor FlgM [Halorhodospira halochloris]BAU58877.1 negative regulator of flagellin synthesis FlgM [Halorhodospira halochloris]